MSAVKHSSRDPLAATRSISAPPPPGLSMASHRSGAGSFLAPSLPPSVPPVSHEDHTRGAPSASLPLHAARHSAPSPCSPPAPSTLIRPSCHSAPRGASTGLRDAPGCRALLASRRPRGAGERPSHTGGEVTGSNHQASHTPNNRSLGALPCRMRRQRRLQCERQRHGVQRAVRPSRAAAVPSALADLSQHGVWRFGRLGWPHPRAQSGARRHRKPASLQLKPSLRSTHPPARWRSSLGGRSSLISPQIDALTKSERGPYGRERNSGSGQEREGGGAGVVLDLAQAATAASARHALRDPGGARAGGGCEHPKMYGSGLGLQQLCCGAQEAMDNGWRGCFWGGRVGQRDQPAQARPLLRVRPAHHIDSGPISACCAARRLGDSPNSYITVPPPRPVLGVRSWPQERRPEQRGREEAEPAARLGVVHVRDRVTKLVVHGLEL
eukprot:scaffold8069_cov126-Isochrysis_galbana.AAC.9